MKNLRITIWKFIETFVGFHIQYHTTFMTFETSFMPNLYKTERRKKNNNHINHDNK